MTLPLPWPSISDNQPESFSSKVQANFETIAGTVGQVVQYSPWVSVTSFSNSWTAALGTTVGYYRDAAGIVRLRGRLAGGVNSSVAFTLPAGYRPGQSEDYAAAAFDGTAAVAGLVHVSTAGAVSLFFAATATDIGLGGVTFRAEQ